MHKCIVCGNRSINTKANRPGVLYHGIPKDECMRRKWLKVFGIDRCYDWQRICSDHFLEENYKPGKKRFLFSNTIPQPYDRNGFSSNYATQSNGVETGNNVILPTEQNIIKEKRIGNAGVNNFRSPRLTRNNEDFSCTNMPDHTLRSGVRCCNHLDCIKIVKLKKILKPGAVPSLYLNNAPTALPVSINEVPVLSTCEDQFISPIDNEAAKQTSEGKQNNVKDDTDNTSMTIDLTIDDSSNSSLSITLEPVEKRTLQCIIMDDGNTEDEHGFIFELSKEVVLPSLYWKSEHLNVENATRFYQQDTNEETVKEINFNNNLVPTIRIYGKKYEFKTPITTMKELDDLLEKIDSIEKCYGRGGFVFKQCLGYFENSLVNMCSGCEGLVKDQDLQRMKAKIEAKNKKTLSLIHRIAEKKKNLLILRKEMSEINRNRHLSVALNLSTLPSGAPNVIKP